MQNLEYLIVDLVFKDFAMDWMFASPEIYMLKSILNVLAFEGEAFES